MHALQLEAGLENKSSLLMIPTMVDMLPQGYALASLLAFLHACVQQDTHLLFMRGNPRSRRLHGSKLQAAVYRHESGEYYAIDLGGTNLRVLYTRLGPGPKEIVSPQRQVFCPEARDEGSTQQGVELACHLPFCAWS